MKRAVRTRLFNVGRPEHIRVPPKHIAPLALIGALLWRCFRFLPPSGGWSFEAKV